MTHAREERNHPEGVISLVTPTREENELLKTPPSARQVNGIDFATGQPPGMFMLINRTGRMKLVTMRFDNFPGTRQFRVNGNTGGFYQVQFGGTIATIVEAVDCPLAGSTDEIGNFHLVQTPNPHLRNDSGKLCYIAFEFHVSDNSFSQVAQMVWRPGRKINLSEEGTTAKVLRWFAAGEQPTVVV